MIKALIIGLIAQFGVVSSFGPTLDWHQDNSYLIAASSDLSSRRIVNNSLGLKTTANSIVAVDVASGETLYQKNISNQQPIASITKLMTALVFLDYNPGLDLTVEIKSDDARQGGIVHMYAGDLVSVNDLLHLTLISSTNEAAAALARVSTASDFVAAMNQKADELGMVDTVFAEPTGLSPENVSTVQDIMLLLLAVSENDVISNITGRSNYSFVEQRRDQTRIAYSTNQLLSTFINRDDHRILVAKTGFLTESGYCLAGIVQKNGTDQIALVVLGSESIDSRRQEAKGVVDWVFNNYLFE